MVYFKWFSAFSHNLIVDYPLSVPNVICRYWHFTESQEGNVLFNDVLNTFYLCLYGIILMVKDHQIARGNLLPLHGLLFLISKKGSFHIHHPIDRITHTMAFLIPVMEHWLEWSLKKELKKWFYVR